MVAPNPRRGCQNVEFFIYFLFFCGDRIGHITPYLDIPEGCVLFVPQNARFFIISDRILIISHAMYLVSNKVASNYAEIAVFLHMYIVPLSTYVHAIHHYQNLKFSKLFGLEDGNKCQIPAKSF